MEALGWVVFACVIASGVAFMAICTHELWQLDRAIDAELARYNEACRNICEEGRRQIDGLRGAIVGAPADPEAFG